MTNPLYIFFSSFFLISLRHFDSGSQYRIHIFTGNGIFEHSRLCTFVHLFPCIQVVFVLHVNSEFDCLECSDFPFLHIHTHA